MQLLMRRENTMVSRSTLLHKVRSEGLKQKNLGRGEGRRKTTFRPNIFVSYIHQKTLITKSQMLTIYEYVSIKMRKRSIHAFLQSYAKLRWIVYSKGRDSLVDIATRYRLAGPGLESRCGKIFYKVQTVPRAHPASNTLCTGSFPGVKRPGRGVDHPPPLAPRLRKE
jgi:hypothetical protein